MPKVDLKPYRFEKPLPVPKGYGLITVTLSIPPPSKWRGTGKHGTDTYNLLVPEGTAAPTLKYVEEAHSLNPALRSESSVTTDRPGCFWDCPVGALMHQWREVKVAR